jgi:hypothetical protein
LSVKNFKRLLISIQKCTELNPELILILVLGLGLGLHPGPRLNIYFYIGEKSAYGQFLTKIEKNENFPN